MKKINSKVCSPWGEDWEETLKRVREVSPYRAFESYKLRPVIVKGGDDLR